MTKKEIATSFLHLASSDKLREAYDNYIHSRFIHHNAYFKGDRESFFTAMENNVPVYFHQHAERYKPLCHGL